MRISFRSLYKGLPIVRELNSIQRSLRQIADGQCKRRLLETSAAIQTLEAIKSSNPRYKDPQRLLTYGAQYWSQNYEDGMIGEIFLRVPPRTKLFFEIGVGDGSENNTTALLIQGWRGWWIDGDSSNCSSVQTRLD